MNVYVVTRNRTKLRAVRDVFAEWHRDVEANVGAVDPPAGLPEQPLGDEVARGAIARAKEGMTPSDADFGVGIEAGLIRLSGSDAWLSCQVCAIADREGRISLGTGPGYELPEELRAAVLAGTPLREALRISPSIDDAEDRGAIHPLSDGRLDRYGITLDAVRMALLSSGRR
jgi:inosine/xanthosine triphosphatase